MFEAACICERVYVTDRVRQQELMQNSRITRKNYADLVEQWRTIDSEYQLEKAQIADIDEQISRKRHQLEGLENVKRLRMKRKGKMADWRSDKKQEIDVHLHELYAQKWEAYWIKSRQEARRQECGFGCYCLDVSSSENEDDSETSHQEGDELEEGEIPE